MTTRDLVLLHTNDMHARGTVFPYLEAHPREAGSLLVDAGDAIRGSNTMFYWREPMLEHMSRVGYDAMALGNREFHYARGVFARRVRQAAFPLLCANVTDLRHHINHGFRRTHVREVAGIRVGFVGVTPVQYPDDSLWRPLFGFRFSPPAEAISCLVRDLRPRVDLVILLSHLGYKADCRLAAEVEGLDVIVGGHSHTVLEEPHRVGSTAIVQAGSHGRFLGRMRLRVGADGSVEIPDYALVPLPGARMRRSSDREGAMS